MARVPKIFKNVRVIILMIAILLGLAALKPNPFNKGLIINAVVPDSPAFKAGLRSPDPNTAPMSRERILEVNGVAVNTVEDFNKIVQELPVNATLTLKTNKNVYFITLEPKFKVITLNETELVNVTEQVFNASTNKTVNVSKQVLRNKTVKHIVGKADIGLKLSKAPKSNLRLGLDLVGGTRVLLTPEGNATREQIQMAVNNIQQRLNVYGLSDIIVLSITDEKGNPAVRIEVPGATEEEVKQLVSKQGKFEAKIGNETVFIGGRDITYVCMSPDCSGLDMFRPCTTTGNGYVCYFRFQVELTPEAAKRHAQITKNLAVVTKQGEQFLNKTLDLYLDDKLVDSLLIGAELRGNPVTSIVIRGSGTGATRQEAIQNTLKNMKELQTLLKTGSLPIKLNIAEIASISPVLGSEFLKNAVMVGFLAMIAVIIVVVARYKKLKVAIPMIITMLSEVFLILSFAALINWRLDLASIAGILIAVGTGVDDQIVITDEVLSKGLVRARTWKERIKKAFFIIFGSYLTTVAAMIPLWTAGAALLRGFALTTIVGVSIGVFITRPAFAAIAEQLFPKHLES